MGCYRQNSHPGLRAATMTNDKNTNPTSQPVGAHNSDSWGIPFSIKDDATARYAVKLSGLPVFLLGLTYGLIGLVMVVGLLTGMVSLAEDPVARMPMAIRNWLETNQMDPFAALKWFFGIYCVLGILLVWWGLKIRNGAMLIVPFAALTYLVWTGITLFFSIHWIQWLMPIPWIILSLNGLRGWWWLRKNS